MRDRVAPSFVVPDPTRVRTSKTMVRICVPKGEIAGPTLIAEVPPAIELRSEGETTAQVRLGVARSLGACGDPVDELSVFSHSPEASASPDALRAWACMKPWVLPWAVRLTASQRHSPLDSRTMSQ